MVSLLILAGIPVVWAVWWVLNQRFLRDGWSPLHVVFWSWVAPLLLRGAGLSDLEEPWGTAMLVTVAWVTLCVVGWSIVLPAVAGPPPRRRETGDSFAASLDVLRNPRSLAVLVLIYAAVFAAYVYAEFLTNPVGVPLLGVVGGGRIPADAHRWGKATRWSIVTPMLYFLSPLCLAAARAQRGRRSRIVLDVLAWLYPVAGILKLSRSDVFIGVLSNLAMASYLRRYAARPGARWRAPFRTLVIAVAGLGLFTALLSIRIGGTTVGNLYGRLIGFRLRGDQPALQVLAAVYGYAALPFENLNRFLISSDGSLHPGVGPTRPILSLAGQGRWADTLDSRIVYPEPVSGAAGSATFVTSVYAELGPVGLAAVPAIYAALVNLIYIRFRRRPTVQGTLLWINFIYPWSWLYFNNAFSVLTTYLNPAYLVLLFVALRESARFEPTAFLPAPQPGAI